MSSSICLVRLWWTGLEDMYTAETLSQYATVASERWQWSSRGAVAAKCTRPPQPYTRPPR
jgi:hypothetical protein